MNASRLPTPARRNLSPLLSPQRVPSVVQFHHSQALRSYRRVLQVAGGVQ